MVADHMSRLQSRVLRCPGGMCTYKYPINTLIFEHDDIYEQTVTRTEYQKTSWVQIREAVHVSHGPPGNTLATSTDNEVHQKKMIESPAGSPAGSPAKDSKRIWYSEFPF